MAIFGQDYMTHVDLLKMTGADGAVLEIAENLALIDEIETDAAWFEGETPDHDSYVQTTQLPTAYRMRLNTGILPSDGDTVMVKEPYTVVKSYRSIHEELLRKTTTPDKLIAAKDKMHMIAVVQKIVNAIFYDNDKTDPDNFCGLAVRASSLSAHNVIAGGAAGGQTDLTSIYLVGWGRAGTYLWAPKGNPLGYSVNDLGRVVDTDSNGKKKVSLDCEHRYACGLSSPEFNSIVRIANLDVSVAEGAVANAPDYIDLMVQALGRIPGYVFPKVRLAFYCNLRMATVLQRHGAAKTIYTTTLDGLGGKPVGRVAGVPVRVCESISVAETAVA